jgi:hypothetical protein
MSYCDCDYDPPTFCEITRPKARKVHRCDECFGPIAAGEHYENVAGLWDGELQTFKTCPLCLELRDWAKISMPCFCTAYTELHETVREMVGDIRSTVPGIVMEWGRRIIRIERRRYREHWPRRLEHQIRASLLASGRKPHEAFREAHEQMRARGSFSSQQRAGEK